MVKKTVTNKKAVKQPKGICDIIDYFCQSIKIPSSIFELFILDSEELSKQLQTLKFLKFFIAPTLDSMYLGKYGALMPEYFIVCKKPIYIMKLSRFLNHYHRDLKYGLYGSGQFNLYLRKLKTLENPKIADKVEEIQKVVTPDSVKKLKESLSKLNKKPKMVKNISKEKVADGS